MKKGFTLIELLVVTVVIVALMSVIFRLTGIVGGTSAQETTVFRMQCLENCLSGYYAAFGAYPQVPLQGRTRNIFRKTHPGCIFECVINNIFHSEQILLRNIPDFIFHFLIVSINVETTVGYKPFCWFISHNSIHKRGFPGTRPSEDKYHRTAFNRYINILQDYFLPQMIPDSSLLNMN